MLTAPVIFFPCYRFQYYHISGVRLDILVSFRAASKVMYISAILDITQSAKVMTIDLFLSSRPTP